MIRSSDDGSSDNELQFTVSFLDGIFEDPVWKKDPPNSGNLLELLVAAIQVNFHLLFFCYIFSFLFFSFYNLKVIKFCHDYFFF